MQPPFCAQIDVSKIDIVSAVWERPPYIFQNSLDLNQLEWSSKPGMMIALLWRLSVRRNGKMSV